MNKNNSEVSTSTFAFGAVLLSFFVMGFVDLVGIASNYVKQDLSLTDSQANILPSLVFLWFLIFSVPTSMLMNKIGRRQTVLLSLGLTLLALVLPILGNGYYLMLVSFSLLGIGNAVMQTSLNPLISSIVSQDKLASSLTFGQFVKAIASFLAPYLAMWGATAVLPDLGLGWRILFPIYAVVSLLSILMLGGINIDEARSEDKSSSFAECFALLSKPAILFSFIGIMCHAGIDVGLNTTAPKILQERLGLSLTEAGFATSLYFIFRTLGCLSGSVILRYISSRTFFMIGVMMMVLSMIGLAVCQTQGFLYVSIALAGFGNSNIFPIIFSQAIGNAEGKENEASGLMIMGIFGATLFPLAMGYASDSLGQLGAVLVMSLGVLYLLVYTLRIRN